MRPSRGVGGGRGGIHASRYAQIGSLMGRQVGKGAYTLQDWVEGYKLTLPANPGLRVRYYPTTTDPQEAPAALANAGKRLPLMGQVEVNVIVWDALPTVTVWVTWPAGL